MAAMEPSISALSPSGHHLAYAVVEQTIAGKVQDNCDAAGAAVDSENQNYEDRRDRQQQQHRHRSEQGGGTDDDGPTFPSISLYHVIITSCHAASLSPIPGGQTSEDGPSMPSSHGLHVNKCPVKAAVTALQWLDESHLACGLQDGNVTIIIACPSESAASTEQQQQRHHNGSNDDRLSLEHGLGRKQEESGGAWRPALSRCFHRARHGGGAEDKSRRVMRIRLSGGGVTGGEGAVAGGATRSSEPTVWVLYPDRVLVGVGVEALVNLARYEVGYTE